MNPLDYIGTKAVAVRRTPTEGVGISLLGRVNSHLSLTPEEWEDLVQIVAILLDRSDGRLPS